MATGSVVKAPCDHCGGKYTNHEVKAEWQSKEVDEYSGAASTDTFQVIVCRGCDMGRFRNEYDHEYMDSEEDIYIRVYPESQPAKKEPMPGHRVVPSKVRRIYEETLAAINAGTFILAGGGLRATVEAICLHQQAAGNSLFHKISDLVTKQCLVQSQADYLHEMRYLGNSALHEIEEQTQGDIDEGLRIIEGMINTLYVLPHSAAALKAKRTSVPDGGNAPS